MGVQDVALRVSEAVIRTILADAERASPDECCGILFGHGEAVDHAMPATNVAPAVRRYFEIDPQTLVDAHRAARGGGPAVVGYYHSHPGGAAAPSATDQAMATGDRRIWAIAGVDGVTFWRDEERGFVPLSYVVEDR